MQIFPIVLAACVGPANDERFWLLFGHSIFRFFLSANHEQLVTFGSVQYADFSHCLSRMCWTSERRAILVTFWSLNIQIFPISEPRAIGYFWISSICRFFPLS